MLCETTLPGHPHDRRSAIHSMFYSIILLYFILYCSICYIYIYIYMYTYNVMHFMTNTWYVWTSKRIWIWTKHTDINYSMYIIATAYIHHYIMTRYSTLRKTRAQIDVEQPVRISLIHTPNTLLRQLYDSPFRTHCYDRIVRQPFPNTLSQTLLRGGPFSHTHSDIHPFPTARRLATACSETV